MATEALVIDAAPDAAHANPYRWHRAEPLTSAVAARELLDEPTPPGAHRALSRALAERFVRALDGELAEAA
ncbi:hypothetical protein NKH77_19770 [Streptomyces sp. M19]